MLKIISKIDCHRCEEIKNYLKGRGIEFEVEMAEDRGYGFWRAEIAKTTGKLGFPILYHTINETYPSEMQNGSAEEIIEKINEWYPIQENKVEVLVDAKSICDHPKFDWGMCDVCGYEGDGYQTKN